MIIDSSTNEVLAEIKCESLDNIRLVNSNYIIKELSGTVIAEDVIIFGE